MKLFIITGLSGSGKSIAIRQLEDQGYFCLDNLPISFLLPVTEHLRAQGTEKIAVAIDARSETKQNEVQHVLKELHQSDINVRILFLTATTPELIRRFSETRRSHPLTHKHPRLSLEKAIGLERDLLSSILDSSLVLDTTNLKPNVLRKWIQEYTQLDAPQLTVTIESFAYKMGVPNAADLVLDARCLPNPYYNRNLRYLTGKDEPVQNFLKNDKTVQQFLSDILQLLEKWLPLYQAQDRNYFTIAVGCTGGQHRSVFIARQIYHALQHWPQLQLSIHHRSIENGTTLQQTL